jgi:hypothetical protein
LKKLLSFLWKAGVRALFGSHCALDNLLDEKLLCVIDGSDCTEFLLEAAVNVEISVLLHKTAHERLRPSKSG